MAPSIGSSALGDASSTTRSAISGGAITITDGAKQQQLTGQTAEEAVASISRDTNSTTNTIAPIFDKDKIEAGFDITSQFINQAGTFVNNRAKEADEAKKAANGQFPTLTGVRAQTLERLLRLASGPSSIEQNKPTALKVESGFLLRSRR